MVLPCLLVEWDAELAAVAVVDHRTDSSLFVSAAIEGKMVANIDPEASSCSTNGCCGLCLCFHFVDHDCCCVVVVVEVTGSVACRQLR